MYDTNHYTALFESLSRAKARLAEASSKDKAFFEHQVKVVEKELAQEAEFLKSKGIDVYQQDSEISDDELLAFLLDD